MKKSIILFCFPLLLISCKKETKAETSKSSEKTISKFVFTKADNPSLLADVEGILTGNEIKLTVFGSSNMHLKPAITYNANAITPDNTVQDFTDPVTYTLTAEDGSTVNYTVSVVEKDFYISGYEFDSQKGKYVAAYWNNQTKVLLTDGTANARSEGIAVVGNDVYVIGNVDLPSGQIKAVYWKNGTMVTLAGNAGITALVYDIAVSGNDVYIVGAIDDKIVYWKNGVLMPFNEPVVSYTTSIFASGEDVYIGGALQPLNSFTIGAVWKNGTSTSYGDGNTSNSSINEISVSGTDVYAAGEDNGNAVYWKNNTKNQLVKGVAYSIANSGSDVYVCGYEDNGAKRDAFCYKNGNKTSLAYGAGNSIALSVQASGSDVVVAGYLSNSSPLAWINGTPVILSSNKGLATGIFINVY